MIPTARLVFVRFFCLFGPCRLRTIAPFERLPFFGPLRAQGHPTKDPLAVRKHDQFFICIDLLNKMNFVKFCGYVYFVFFTTGFCNQIILDLSPPSPIFFEKGFCQQIGHVSKCRRVLWGDLYHTRSHLSLSSQIRGHIWGKQGSWPPPAFPEVEGVKTRPIPATGMVAPRPSARSRRPAPDLRTFFNTRVRKAGGGRDVGQQSPG